ncbi:hypothetical protein [uncultured Eudoraea sp.]|uniref:hypothetical protein n=1 Tax=uncultured Eudoraea sp. TaxID=1035614 RepID=UPI0026078E83|nr:hypothetical protein [uncultured Eudoraea sp.]
MGFEEQNKYFLRQRFTSEFYKSSIDQKDILYKSFRDELLKRITHYYNNISESGPAVICKFYKELIELIWDYDKDFILTNLLFEKDFNSVITCLDKNQRVFETRLSYNNDLMWGLEFFFKKFLDETDIYFSSTLKDFLNDHLSSFTSLRPNNWEIKRNNTTNSIKVEVIHIYTKFLISNIENTEYLKKMITIHILFTRAWHLNFKFENINEIKITILFLDQLIKSYRESFFKGNTPILHQFILALNRKYLEIFAQGFVQTPLFDTAKRKDYPKGYHIKRKELEDLILQNEFLLDSTTHELEYYELFRIYTNTNSAAVMEKIRKSFKEKINISILPQSEELDIIEDLCHENESGIELLHDLYKHFYLFERMI